jgi:regulator of protease activity HflC (stomatin/prohibitin superfamily)
MSIGVVFLILIVLIILGLRMDQEYERGVIFRLGRFLEVKGPA